MRPRCDYRDIIYNRYKDSFHQKLEAILYNSALAITRAIRETSGEKLF